MPPSVANEMIRFNDSTVSDDGVSVISFSVPSCLSSQFIAFFESMFSMFRYSIMKVKHKQAVIDVNDQVIAERRNLAFKHFESYVLKDFDKNRKSGLSVRESVNAVKLKLNRRGDRYTCYQIELIARKNGRLSKGYKAHV